MASNNDENIAMLMSMGFDRNQSIQALSACPNLERAIEFLLSSGVGSGESSSRDQSAASINAQSNSNDNIDAVHSEVSQYSDSLGKSACTSIALTMGCNFLSYMTRNNENGNPREAVNSEFLSDSIKEGITMYSAISQVVNGVEHSSVEELLNACATSGSTSTTAKHITSTMKLLDSSPRQGILSNLSDNPMGLETILSQCQADAIDPQKYIAVVITKPPETVLLLLPPASDRSSFASYILLDSHPRPQQLAPHFPNGSYALFHSTLESLVASVKQIFPATELGDDVPEMMAMMYNSFDAYPFQHRRDSAEI